MADKKKEDAAAAAEDDFFEQLKQQALALAGNAQQDTVSYLGLPGGKPLTGGALETQLAGTGKEYAGQGRYTVGYMYMPQVLNWDPVKKKRLQGMLVNSGLLSEDFQHGAWDEASAKAFGTILAMANQSGNDWETELSNYYSQQPKEYDSKTGTFKVKTPGQGSLRERQPLTIKHTNPNDLVRVANEVAEKRLGRKFNQDELSRFVSSYQGMERGEQTNTYNAAEGGGTVTAAASPETVALQQAEAADPVAFATRSALPMVDAINEMMNGLNFGETKPMGG